MSVYNECACKSVCLCYVVCKNYTQLIVLCFHTFLNNLAFCMSLIFFFVLFFYVWFPSCFTFLMFVGPPRVPSKCQNIHTDRDLSQWSKDQK